jgi:hypothetical protein
MELAIIKKLSHTVHAVETLFNKTTITVKSESHGYTWSSQFNFCL